MSISTVLVTGAFGQVGQHLTGLLLERGHRVVAMDLAEARTAAAASALSAAGPAGRLIPAFADLLDADAVVQVLNEHRPAAIVHLAALVAPPAYRNPLLARRVNVDATKILLAAARDLPYSPHVVYASSAAVYGSRNPYRYP